MDKFIGFPGLGLSFNVNPVAFTLFGKDVYWYGVIIGCAIILAVILCTYLGKKQGISSDTILDIVLIGTPTAVIFARIYYCIFSWEKYADEPWKVFYIWEGGIAIYGAIIGAVLAAYIYCRVKKLDWRKIFDVCIVGVILGQAIGRWGNFVNREAFGNETTLPWRMELHSIGGTVMFVHPTFLYESLWNILGTLLLIWVNNHKTKDGEAFFMYFVWYGIGRFFVEGLRTDSLYWGPFRFSQVFAVLTAILGLIALFILKKDKIKRS
ncbi:MAG: prolipoprotein diacylglyceryl transferase [Clostridia bacterium]|nr:prolipoprotein diacylglyceryl transferase [Clostridia bacterium]